LECAQFARFGALAVTDVDGRRFMVARSEGSANAGIHAAAEENYGSDHRVIG